MKRLHLTPSFNISLDENQDSVHVLLLNDEEYKLYTQFLDLQKSNTEEVESSTESLWDQESNTIKLPHGGPNGVIYLPNLLHVFNQLNIDCLPIHNRAQGLESFSENEYLCLDILLRRGFTDPEKPYLKNTMQAVRSVVEALVETGYFTVESARQVSYFRNMPPTETKSFEPKLFDRSVRCLKVKSMFDIVDSCKNTRCDNNYPYPQSHWWLKETN